VVPEGQGRKTNGGPFADKDEVNRLMPMRIRLSARARQWYQRDPLDFDRIETWRFLERMRAGIEVPPAGVQLTARLGSAAGGIIYVVVERLGPDRIDILDIFTDDEV
jgi:hypothetical protein